MEWISVEDRLPEDNNLVWVYSSYHGCYPAYYSRASVMKGRWIHVDLSDTGQKITNVTHWMTLPKPPYTEV